MTETSERWTITTEHHLDGLDLEWQVGINTVARWDEMSDYEQIVFIEEWAIPRGYYQELAQRADEGRLSDDERRRCDKLRTMISEHRPAIEAILEAPAI